MQLSLGSGEIYRRVCDLLHTLVVVGEGIHALARPVGIAGKGAHEPGGQLAVAFADLLVEVLLFDQAVKKCLAVVEAEASEQYRIVGSDSGNFYHYYVPPQI